MSKASPSNDGQDRSGRWAPWVATGIIALIVIGAVVAYFRPEAFTPVREKEKVEVISGTACGPLRRTEAALTKGQTAELKAAVSEAELKAIKALDSSGVRFGEPERFALRLSARSLNNLAPDQLRELEWKLHVVVQRACPILPRREPV
jgi:hypothetical protein